MNYFVLDTSAIVHVLRDTPNGQKLNEYLEKLEDEYSLLVSTATVGELNSIKLQRNWNEESCRKLDKFLEDITAIDIAKSDISLINNYASLDAFSLRKIADPNGNFKEGSAIGMGKNDLWIAATALTMHATLITSDGDFDHLNDIYLEIFKI